LTPYRGMPTIDLSDISCSWHTCLGLCTRACQQRLAIVLGRYARLVRHCYASNMVLTQTVVHTSFWGHDTQSTYSLDALPGHAYYRPNRHFTHLEYVPWVEFEGMPIVPCYSLGALRSARTAWLLELHGADTNGCKHINLGGHAYYRPVSC
jgi:hypothetical protein